MAKKGTGSFCFPTKIGLTWPYLAPQALASNGSPSGSAESSKLCHQLTLGFFVDTDHGSVIQHT